MKNLKVDLFGIPYEIRFVKEKAITKDYCGKIMYDEQEIVINEELKKETQSATILHEITHSIIRQSGIEKIIEDNKIDSEHIVELLSSNLFNVMTSNKELFIDLFLKRFNA